MNFMSCILYSRASYRALAKTQIFICCWRDELASRYESPEAFADALFDLNAKAYQDRYGHHTDIEDDIRDAENDLETDSEFIATIKAEAERYNDNARVLAAAKLWQSCGRIQYQCSDARGYHDIPAGWHLQWLKNHAGRIMCEYIEAHATPKTEPTTTPPPPPNGKPQLSLVA